MSQSVRERTYFETLTVKIPSNYEEKIKKALEKNKRVEAAINRAVERFKELLEKGKE